MCKHVRIGKVIFNVALRNDLVLFSPFDRIKGKAPSIDKSWHNVSIEEFDRLLSSCANVGWRAFLAMCRLAGLRRGEALERPWDDVDWQARRLTVISQKTKKRRVVPIEPGLYQLLLEAFEAAEPGDNLIVSEQFVSRNNLRVRFQAIIKRAGLETWPGLYQVLRRNRETDWAQIYPQYVVSTWMGHDIAVSSEFYLQLPEELYNSFAGIPETRPFKPMEELSGKGG